MQLSARKLKILSAVIDSYVQSAEPVSSKFLCDLLGFSVSSATIRNELAELTELGFLEQPHTSAGRIPSNLGYRLYINKLMSRAHLSRKTKDYIDSELDLTENDPDIILKNAANLLAKMTNYAVLSTNVSTQKNAVRNIQLVQVGPCATMIILTTSSGIIKNRVFRFDFLLTTDVLISLNKMLNENFVGVLLSEITPAYIQTVAASLGEIALFTSDALSTLLEVARQASKVDFHFDGQTNLLLVPEFNQQSAIKLMNFFIRADDISNLFLLPEKHKTCIFIGQENLYEELAQSSLVITKYRVNGESYGVLGVVGPTRMNYPNVITNLEYVASLLGRTLEKLLDFE